MLMTGCYYGYRKKSTTEINQMHLKKYDGTIRAIPYDGTESDAYKKAVSHFLSHELNEAQNFLNTIDSLSCKEIDCLERLLSDIYFYIHYQSLGLTIKYFILLVSVIFFLACESTSTSTGVSSPIDGVWVRHSLITDTYKEDFRLDFNGNGTVSYFKSARDVEDFACWGPDSLCYTKNIVGNYTFYDNQIIIVFKKQIEVSYEKLFWEGDQNSTLAAPIIDTTDVYDEISSTYSTVDGAASLLFDGQVPMVRE